MNKTWRRQRFHFTNSGYPKVKYKSLEDATLVAKEINQKKVFGVDELVEPYVCKMCNNWHIGRSSKAKKDSTLWHEIGDRAYYNLAAENARSEQIRIMRIRNRFRFLGPEYGVDRLR